MSFSYSVGLTVRLDLKGFFQQNDSLSVPPLFPPFPLIFK